MTIEKVLTHKETQFIGFFSNESKDSLIYQSLPLYHQNLLLIANGMTILGGYLRLFGFKRNDYLDIEFWNDMKTWKFAWGDELSQYLCFCETFWGTQYAYRFDEFNKSDQSAIYQLDAFTMDAKKIADRFEDFLNSYFMCHQLDLMTNKVKRKLGQLSLREHATYSPSILLDPSKKLSNVVKLNAVDSMIINGDLYQQLIHNSTRVVESIQIYKDEHGRNRLRVNWN